MVKSGLDFGKLLNTFIGFGIDDLHDYQEKIEKLIKDEKTTMDSKFDKIESLSKDNEEYYKMLVDDLSEQYHNFDRYYPNRFRSSLIIQTYSFLEFHLKEICNRIPEHKILNLKVDSIKGGSDLEKSKTYLTKTIKINFGNLNPEWSYFNKIRILRNSIVHSAGVFNIKEAKLRKFILEHKSLTVKDNENDLIHGKENNYEILIIGDELNIEFLSHIRSFFNKLTDEVFK